MGVVWSMAMQGKAAAGVGVKQRETMEGEAAGCERMRADEEEREVGDEGVKKKETMYDESEREERMRADEEEREVSDEKEKKRETLDDDLAGRERKRAEEKERDVGKEKVWKRLPAPTVVPDLEVEVVDLVEGILEYQFQEKNLLAEALTHPSYYLPCKPGPSSDRLEYVGDAVLNLLVAREVFTSYPGLPPGPLTRLRAANVDTEKLARIAVNHGIHRHLRHKAPVLEQQIREFMEATAHYPLHSHGLVDPPKVLADIVESLLGAVFVDSKSSLETVWKVYWKLAQPLISLDTLGKHPVSELYEFCQKRALELKFVKDTWAENTMVQVYVDKELVGSATYRQKKEIALNRAAKAALDKLKEEELAQLDSAPPSPSRASLAPDSPLPSPPPSPVSPSPTSSAAPSPAPISAY